MSFDFLEKLALEYDLKLIEKKNFHEFYDDNISLGDNKALFERMVASQVNDKMSE